MLSMGMVDRSTLTEPGFGACAPRYSPDGPYYRLGSVHACPYVRVA